MGKRKRRGRRVSASRKRRQKQLARRMLVAFTGVFLCVTALVVAGKKSTVPEEENPAVMNEVTQEPVREDEWAGAPEIDVQLLDVNEYSRPGTPLTEIKGIVIHYIGNPGTSAQANRDYFQELKDAHLTKASSHFVVGLEGEIIQCIPTSEISYASNHRNKDTVSIECCHPDATGKFNESTYESVVSLTAWLCTRFDLTTQDVIRHHDVTGKLCPMYYVEHEDAWLQLKADVDARIQEIEKGEI